MFLFLFFSMLSLCSFFRLKELFQVKNGVTTSLLFLFENAKNLCRSDDGTRRKKTGWPEMRSCVIHHIIENVQWFGTQVCQVFIQTKIISNFIVLNLTADWRKALAQVILMVSK